MSTLLLVVATSQGVVCQESPANGVGDGRVIVLGFDGIDNARCRRLMARGKLKNLAALSESGTFVPLQTTTPAQSPVSWSSLITGMNPGRTGIDGFLRRRFTDEGVDVELSLVSREVDRTGMTGRGNRLLFLSILGVALAIGAISLFCRRRRRWAAFCCALLIPLAVAIHESNTQIPDGKPVPVNQRQEQTYWERLDERGISSSTLMAPCCFPAEHMDNGRLLCGLGVPDIAGSPGFWSVYSSNLISAETTETGGRLLPLLEADHEDALVHYENAHVYGPPNLLDTNADRITTELKVAVDRELKLVKLDNSLSAANIPEGEWSKPFSFLFPMGRWARVRGKSRFKVISAADPLKLYLDPIGFDPAELPDGVRISHPDDHALRLQLACGPFETVGWACATNALKDGQIDEKAFLEDALRVWTERETMALHELARNDTKIVTAIFTATDRIQHMFSRYDWTDKDVNGNKARSIYTEAIDQAYERMDDFVGRVMQQHVGPNDTIMIVSDHGFATWRRAVNLNRFLIENGHLTLKDRTGVRTLADHLGGGAALDQVDWSRTKAYSVGLGKIYLNRKGREPGGIITEEDAPGVIEDISNDLRALGDDVNAVVSAITLGATVYDGDAIPEGRADIYVGFHPGYRVSWQSCLGGADEPIIFDNDSAWSGDHCSVDPALVPGVLFSNRQLDAARARVVDVAPTILDLFGVDLPANPDSRDGRSLLKKR